MCWAAFLLATCAVAYQPGRPFVEGEVCDGQDLSASPASLLRGKHLLVNGFEYFPLLYSDPSQPSGWGGVDINLLDQLSAKLGFNYTVRDMGLPTEGSSWMEHFVSEVHNADVMLTWWKGTPSRINHGLFVTGHVDVTMALLSRATIPEEDHSWYATFYRWSLPFDPSLWFCILVLIVMTAAVAFLVERHEKSAVGYAWTLYEYTAGALWGGYGPAKSATSAIYQVVFSFVMLILVSSYTANLAAYITLHATPTLVVKSMDQAVLEQRAVCADFNMPWGDKLSKLFPRAAWVDTFPFLADGEFHYLHDDCDGMVVPVQEWRMMKMDPEWCPLHRVEVIADAETAGWATNSKSGCVARALSWAMADVIESGQVGLMLKRHFPPAACTATSRTSATSRRLEGIPSSGRPSGQFVGLTAASDGEGEERRVMGGRVDAARRAVATKERGVVAQYQDASSNKDSQQMTAGHFLGLFSVWGLISVLSLWWAYCVPDSWKRKPLEELEHAASWVERSASHVVHMDSHDQPLGLSPGKSPDEPKAVESHGIVSSEVPRLPGPLDDATEAKAEEKLQIIHRQSGPLEDMSTKIEETLRILRRLDQQAARRGSPSRERRKSQEHKERCVSPVSEWLGGMSPAPTKPRQQKEHHQLHHQQRRQQQQQLQSRYHLKPRCEMDWDADRRSDDGSVV